MNIIDSLNNEARLAELQTYHIFDTLPEAQFDFITQLAAQICGTPIALISIIDQKRQWFKSHYGTNITETPVEYSFCTHAILSAEPFYIIEDASKDPRFKDLPFIKSKPAYIYYLGIPLISPNGLAFGTLCVVDYETRTLEPAIIETMKGLAQQVVNLLEFRRKSLQLSELTEKYKSLNEHIAHAIFLLNGEGNIIEANERAVGMMGYAPNELIHTHITDYCTKFTKDDFLTYWQESDEQHSTFFETVHQHKSGKLVPVEVTAYTSFQCGVKYIYYLCRDISEKKEAEQQMQQSEDFYRFLTEYSSDMICLQTTDGNYQYISPSVKHLLGYESNELIHTDPISLIHPNDLALHKKEFYELGRQYKDISANDFRFRHKNGQYKWINSYSKVILDEFAKVKFISSSLRDITDKKLAEKSLKEAEKRYRTFINSLSEGVYRFDLSKPLNINLPLKQQIEHLYQYAYMRECNEEFLSMYRLKKEHIMGKKLEDFLKSEHLPKNISIVKRFVQTGYRITQEITVEPVNDGEIRYYSNDIFGIINEEDQLIRLWGTQTDITKLKTYEKELIIAKEIAEEKERELKEKNEKIALQNQVYFATNMELAESYSKASKLNKELQKANQELDNFVYRVSHDLRSPVSSSLALIDLALQEQDPEQLREYLLMQETSLFKQDKFIRDILDYSRNTRKLIEPVEVNVKEMIEEIISMNIHEYQKTTCSLNIEGSEVIICDSMRMQMILSNLISNSFKYSNFHETPKVEVRAEINDQEAYIRVEDNGIGIPEKDQPEVFKMFYRATSRSNGSGLGLYIVKEAIDKMKASIQLHSEVGKGTCIEVHIPNMTAKK